MVNNNGSPQASESFQTRIPGCCYAQASWASCHPRTLVQVLLVLDSGDAQIESPLSLTCFTAIGLQSIRRDNLQKPIMFGDWTLGFLQIFLHNHALSVNFLAFPRPLWTLDWAVMSRWPHIACGMLEWWRQLMPFPLRSDSHVENKPNNTKVWVWICGPSSQGMCRWQGERTRQRKTDDIWQCIIVAGHISNNHPEQKCLKFVDSSPC